MRTIRIVFMPDRHTKLCSPKQITASLAGHLADLVG
jgi:hypothetical protein